MQDRNTYIYTQHSDESVGRLVQAHYLPEAHVQCRFHVSGLHDNYFVECGGRKFMLRLYRADWRNEAEALFELELLDYLQGRQAPVAGPVRTRDGSLSVALESPEGKRMAALFHYAEGHAPEGALSIGDCQLLGRVVAEVHQAAEGFVASHARPELDFTQLVEEPIALYAPFMDPDARAYLEGLQDRLRQVWPQLPREAGMYGPCTGDINNRNFHITAGQKITLFDFDQCGMGDRAFEIGKFASSIHHHANKQELLNAFLAGYQPVRWLGEDELQAIPVYEMAAVIWVLGIAAKNIGRIGYKYTEKPYWGRKIDMLKVLEARRAQP